MFHRGHVDHKAAGQRDVRSNAGAFLAQRLFGDLNDDLLALFEQVGNGGQRKTLALGALGAFAASGALSAALRTFCAFRTFSTTFGPVAAFSAVSTFALAPLGPAFFPHGHGPAFD